jgi:phage terminase large subunit-like protein
VLLPKDAPWLEAFVSELLSFPGRHDDQVDAFSLSQLRVSGDAEVGNE